MKIDKINFRNLELVEMATVDDELLVGSLPFAPLIIPWHINIGGDYLFWEDLATKRTTATDKGALNAFVRIKKSKDILDFARLYGPLGLCDHGKPPWHKADNGERHWCPPYEENGDLRWGKESLNRWLDYVEAAQTMLNAAADWKINPNKKLANGLHTWSLKTFVGAWLADAGIRFDLVGLPQGNFTLSFSGDGVFGAIGLQLLQAITDNTLAICNGCGKPYSRPGRKPQKGRNNYCPNCGDTVASRIRVQNWRSKQNKGKEGSDTPLTLVNPILNTRGK
jgi:DNA-directed RNA polymerase subunit RPC12/RpoP